MSKTNFTPGPWSGNGCSIYAESWKGPQNVRGCVAVCAYTDERMPSEMEANAHLIAASPCMYEALEKALQWMDSWGCVNGAISANEKADIENVMENALAKARGEQQ